MFGWTPRSSTSSPSGCGWRRLATTCLPCSRRPRRQVSTGWSYAWSNRRSDPDAPGIPVWVSALVLISREDLDTLVTSISRVLSSPSFRSIRPARLLRQAVLGAGISYAGAVLGYALLRPLLGERTGWIELADDLEPWAYLPAPAVAILGAVLGSGGLAAGGAAVAATCGVRWGHRFLRRSPAAASVRPASDLTVMTFNTLAWQREGRDLEGSIAQADPDIVGLQEIGPRGAEYLVRAFADRLPYHYVAHSATSSGAAVLSRYPLREAVAFRA